MSVNIADVLKPPTGHRDEVWSRIVIVAEAFWGPIEPDHGVALSSLDEAEQRLARTIPLALREGYRLVGAHPNLSSQDLLLPPDRMSVDGGTFLRFRVENQGCAEWACRVDEPTDDPPVHMRVPSGAWQPDLGPVSAFFLHMVLSEILMSSTLADNGPLDEQRVGQLEAALDELPIPPFLFWPDPSAPPRRFFGGPDLLVADDAGTWMWAAVLSSRALDDLRSQVPGEWLMRADGP